MTNINNFPQLLRALTDERIDQREETKRSSTGVGQSEITVSDIIGGIVVINPLDPNAPDNPMPNDPSPGHPPDQVTDPPTPDLFPPKTSEISIEQQLIPPSISSDVASVSVDIIIDGNSEKYEINWVTA